MQAGLDVVEVGIPETLRQCIEHQIAYVPLEAQRVLEMASVAGVAFTTATVAAGLEDDVMAVEAHCEALARRHLVRSVGLVTWPDGTGVTRYEFTHALYQQVAYERLGPGHRGQLHQRLGIRLEATYGRRAEEIATELAEHFARGHDFRRAVRYLHWAAENAAHRSVPREVIKLLTQVLALLRQFPETSEHTQQEFDLQMTLGSVFIATKGYAALEVAQTYARAHVLCHQVLESPQLAQTLVGLCLFHTVQGAHQTAQKVGRRLLRLAERLDDSVALLNAHCMRGLTALYLGDVVSGRVHFAQGIALYDRLTHRPLALNSLWDFGVVCRIGMT